MVFKRASHFIKRVKVLNVMSVNGSPKTKATIASLAFVLLTASFVLAQTTPRSPSDVVREFYKALHERRFKEAWSLTIYKPAVQDLSAEEMEDLRAGFEEEAVRSPEQVE